MNIYMCVHLRICVGWRQARSLRWRRRAPPKAAQTAVSPEKSRAAIGEAPLLTPKASLSSPRKPPTACLDPRSARRRAKRGARRGARTAHRLGGAPAHTSEPEESWARRARLDHYQDGPLRARGPCSLPPGPRGGASSSPPLACAATLTGLGWGLWRGGTPPNRDY